jgi:hypothetical protein
MCWVVEPRLLLLGMLLWCVKCQLLPCAGISVHELHWQRVLGTPDSSGMQFWKGGRIASTDVVRFS